MSSSSLYQQIYVQVLLTSLQVLAWSPNPVPKHVFKYDQFESQHFYGNSSEKDNDYFKILHQEYNSVLVGARNTVYNISVHNLSELASQRISWAPSGAHRELCLLKGKSEDDCHNYIRVGAKLEDNSLLVCGTNAYRPLCRKYKNQDGTLTPADKDIEGPGRCPFSPSHNSTALFTDGHLYTATVADFSGGEPLIYREPQRTERSDLKQLNDPSFVSSLSYGNYVLFFFREAAVEYINCGKAVYSRVARVCKSDKGGPHQFWDRWTTFLKSRLNCSMPGEYPFYFDEIQATSDVVQGEYGGAYDDIIYGVFNTPVNSIGGSAICAFSMRQLMDTFDGPFKEQDGMNANWLPVPHSKVPEPRPGACVNDSRTLPDFTVNFVKTHSLMNNAVPSYFSHPVSIKVSWTSKFSSIAVDPQVRALSGTTYDVIFVGTEDGKVVKIVNVASGGVGTQTRALVIEELQVLPPGTPVQSLSIVRTVSQNHAKLLVVSNKQLTHIALHRCKVFSTCADCVNLQDPYCAWDTKLRKCVPYQERSALPAAQFVQNILKPASAQCPEDSSSDVRELTDEQNEIDNRILDSGSESDGKECAPTKCPSCVGQCADSLASQAASQQDKIVIYTGNTLGLTVLTSVLLTLLIGFTAGYLCSRYVRNDTYTNIMPFHARQQLNRLDNSSNLESGAAGTVASSWTSHPNNKNTLNLVMNVCHETERSPKNDLNEKNSTLENSKNTLQKVKKTYI
uniref:Semaphorin-1A n=1 Tax=Cacopsylla melanoneura TaxID=428564 RepID=A0A8D8PZV1_9HEMI